MPHIEVLPNSTLIRVPGWTLVPDTGRGLAQVAAQPSAGRKRAARSTNTAGGDTTASQQNAVLKHLADLDKDNQRDVQIAVPVKQKGNAGRSRYTAGVTCIIANMPDSLVQHLRRRLPTSDAYSCHRRLLPIILTTKWLSLLTNLILLQDLER